MNSEKDPYLETATGEYLDNLGMMLGLKRKWYEKVFESLFRKRLIEKHRAFSGCKIRPAGVTKFQFSKHRIMGPWI